MTSIPRLCAIARLMSYQAAVGAWRRISCDFLMFLVVSFMAAPSATRNGLPFSILLSLSLSTPLDSRHFLLCPDPSLQLRNIRNYSMQKRFMR